MPPSPGGGGKSGGDPFMQGGAAEGLAIDGSRRREYAEIIRDSGVEKVEVEAADVYRFEVPVGAKKDLTYKVVEEREERLAFEGMALGDQQHVRRVRGRRAARFCAALRSSSGMPANDSRTWASPLRWADSQAVRHGSSET